MCVLTHSQFDAEKGMWFVKKIGCYSIAERVQAKHLSKNRQRGMFECKPLNLTKELYKTYLKQYVILDIIAKQPRKTLLDDSLVEETV